MNARSETIKLRNGFRFKFGPIPRRQPDEYIPIGAKPNPLPPQRSTVLDLKIVATDNAYYVKWHSSNPEYVSSNTWHKTLEDALREAEHSFDLKPDDWDMPGNERRTLFLFSGMGGDSRLFRELRVPSAHLIAPDHLEPEDGETLVQYARRVAEHHAIGQHDIVGGASFGGMLAAQIANDRKAAGLIMLGSCFGPSGLPSSLATSERISRWLPDGALKIKSWRPLIRWRFDPITPKAEETILAMGKDFPADWLRRFARMIAEWPGVSKPACPTHVIHGDRDRLIACDPKIADLVIPDAGHAFMLTHAEPTNAAIAGFIASNRPG